MSNPDNSSAPRTSTGRTILAVAVGLIVIFILHAGTDAVMHATGIFPPMGKPMANSLWLLAMGYRAVTSVLGCYLTARLAPARPIWHALILGWVGVILSLLGVLAFWNKGPEFGPKWYPISLVLIALPCAWIGGKLCEMQLSKYR